MSIAIPCGSRGVHNIYTILKTLVDYCKSKGAHPFIFPAMGSHGGSTAEGQLEVVNGFGITEESIGLPHQVLHGGCSGRSDRGRPYGFRG